MRDTPPPTSEKAHLPFSSFFFFLFTYLFLLWEKVNPNIPYPFLSFPPPSPSLPLPHDQDQALLIIPYSLGNYKIDCVKSKNDTIGEIL